ncbi:MAG: hypothetical protein GYB35_16070 [Algicola sp.]|nr:hypothetical protein [Algicola sp.]
MKAYPKYLTFENRKKTPSVLNQEYPIPKLNSEKKYYPDNKYILPLLSNDENKKKFAIVLFYIFLKDTIEVEHFLVIPAIANLKRLNYPIPNKAKEDLYKIATDEGFHAEQSLVYLNKLKDKFNIEIPNDNKPPRFIAELEKNLEDKSNSEIKHLLPLIFGIVTETRISIELGQFAKNKGLDDSVREICLSHAIDEVVHSSQFQALGEWLWNFFDVRTKELISEAFVDAIIARNLPDIEDLIIAFSIAENISLTKAEEHIKRVYNENILIDDMLEVCEPTLKYLKRINIIDEIFFYSKIEQLRKELKIKLSL